nr:reverse transcriptase domain-containing protein [Tanacetum cinerariifolium]
MLRGFTFLLAVATFFTGSGKLFCQWELYNWQWECLVHFIPNNKDLLRACPHHGFTELHQLDTFYNALNPADQNSLNSAVGGNLLERRTQDVLTIIENKSKQTSAVTTAMTAILKQFQATPPPAFVKAVEEICVTCGGAHPYYQDNIQGYVAAAAVNYNQEEDERVEETLADQDLAEYTIKVPPPLDAQEKTTRKDEVQIHKFWQMFKQLHINITLADVLILIPKYQKMLKALLSNKEKLQELANTPLNDNCSAVILKKLPEKLRDPGKFLISCGFNKLKCKALADLGSSINLMPLYVWKKLGRPFLRTVRALIDVRGEEMILHDGDERLTLNIRHDTSSYSNQPQNESIKLINVFNDSSKVFLKSLFSINHQSGNLTYSSHPELALPEVKDDIFDPEGGNVLPEKLLDLDSTKDLHPPHHVNPLSGSTTSSSSPNQLPEEFADELALITFPPGNSILKDSIDQSNLADLNDNLINFMTEMFTDEHAFDYSSPSLYDEYDDDLFEVESDTKNIYDDPFDSKKEKIKESKLLIDELDLPSDFLPSSVYDSFLSEDFSKVDALPSTNNEDKVFNLGILIHENIFEIITYVAPEKNEKKLAISNAFLCLRILILLSMNFLSLKKFPDIPRIGRLMLKDFVLQSSFP